MAIPGEDTIAAIATPVGLGGIGIIRLSGPDALSIAIQLCQPNQPYVPRKVYSCTVSGTDGTLLDQGCLIYFKAPKSYTGEDVIELQVHGSPISLQKILTAILDLGGRLADRGEFTRRAFLNGKLSLSDAETVADIIHATSPAGHRVALNRVKGKLHHLISRFRKQLMHLLEQLSGAIDFPDEVPPLNREVLQAQLSEMQQELSRVLAMQDFGKQVSTQIKCLIVGQPNVGKSSLFNAFLGENRAIVTQIPGTTRDFISAPVSYNGYGFEFLDTAGLRTTPDPIEEKGIRQVQKLVKAVHFVLWVVDGTRPVSAEDHAIQHRFKQHPRQLLLLNKSDRKRQVFDPNQLPKGWSNPLFRVSAKKNHGLDQVLHHLGQTLTTESEAIDLDYICNLRQLNCLKTLAKNFTQLQSTLDQGFEDDCLSIDLKQAIATCGEITGEDITDAVLDGIFNRFCVGK